MGIIYSFLGWTTAEVEDPITGLTPRQISLMKKSWNVASKDRTKLGSVVMLGLFKDYPEYKQLFPFKNVSDEDLINDVKFKVHCNTVVTALGQITDALEDSKLIVGLLDKTATNHTKHGAPPEGFLNIQKSIENALRPFTDDETSAAWSKLLTVALNHIKNKMTEEMGI